MHLNQRLATEIHIIINLQLRHEFIAKLNRDIHYNGQ